MDAKPLALARKALNKRERRDLDANTRVPNVHGKEGGKSTIARGGINYKQLTFSLKDRVADG